MTTSKFQLKNNNQRKKRVLILTRGLFIGGAELVIENICTCLNREVFEISVCYLHLDGPVSDKLRKQGIDVFCLSDLIRTKSKYLSFFYLARIVKEKKIDIIHSHGTAALFESSLCKLITPKLKLIHTFHYGNYPKMDRRNLFLEKLSWRIPDKLIAVGNEQRIKIKKTFKIASEDRITTVWNGIIQKENNINKTIVEHIVDNSKVIVGSLSTLIEQKGLTYLLDAICLLKKMNNNFKVVIAGDGPLREELERKSKSKKLDEIIYFTGWIENAAYAILPVFDIFCQSSLWEAMSMVVLEAMAAGIPVVATDVGENKHIVKNGHDGYVLKPKDSRAMAHTLNELINDQKLRKWVGVNAQRKVLKKFTAQRMADNYGSRYLELYQQKRL